MKSTFLIIIICSSATLCAQQYETMQIALDSNIYSEALGYDKHIQLLVPDTYGRRNKNTYPLIVVFDMQNSINYQYIVGTIDYLSGFGQIPECLVAGIEAAERPGRYRETQLTENSEDALGKENEEFIFEELIPFLQNKYSANDQIILFGHSRFGYFTTHLLTQRPKDLLGVISVSPFYFQKNTDHVERLVKMLEEVELKHNLYYVPSVGDTITDTYDFYKMKSALLNIRIPEKFKFYPLTNDVADHIVTPGLTVGQAFYRIFREWNVRQMLFHRTSRVDIQVLHEELEQEVATIYGASIPLSLGVYNGTGWRFYNDGQFAPAIENWELMMKYYPSFSYGWVFIADALTNLGRSNELESFLNKAAESLDSNTYLDASEIEEVKEYILELRHK
jgi:tetratricopeptide (TPR) repeat protein